MKCPEREDLLRGAMAALHKLNRLTQEQIESLRSDDILRLLELDVKLETAFGEKERSLGALTQHRKDHRCC